MSVESVSVDEDSRLGELYGRYKKLALAAGAALVLGAPHDALEDEARELLVDARSALADGVRHETQLGACVEAAAELLALLVRGGDVGAVRSTHKRFRREVWKVIPCEYVPCCAAASHEHE